MSGIEYQYDVLVTDEATILYKETELSDTGKIYIAAKSGVAYILYRTSRFVIDKQKSERSHGYVIAVDENDSAIEYKEE